VKNLIGLSSSYWTVGLLWCLYINNMDGVFTLISWFNSVRWAARMDNSTGFEKHSRPRWCEQAFTFFMPTCWTTKQRPIYFNEVRLAYVSEPWFGVSSWHNYLPPTTDIYTQRATTDIRTQRASSLFFSANIASVCGCLTGHKRRYSYIFFTPFSIKN